MTDEKKNAETKSAAKPKSTTKAKTAAKAKAKPKAETKIKANPADAAPYMKKDSKAESSHAESPERKSSTPLVILVIAAFLVITTIYKFNDERSSQPEQAAPQETTATAETTSAAMMQADPANAENPASNNADTQSVNTPEQPTPPAYEKTREPAGGQAQVRTTINDEMMQQRRQAFEKEIQSKRQQYRALMDARRQERAEIAEKQKAEFERMRQHHLETRQKAQEIQNQIFALHEKLNQLMRESHEIRKP